MTAPIYILTQGPVTWASSRLRGFWLAEAAPDLFDVYSGGAMPELDGREMLVFQKRHTPADIGLAAHAKERGMKVVFDLTDPLWWWSPDTVNAMMELADVVTVSSRGLHEIIKDIPVVKKVVHIPDRFRPQDFPQVREHEDSRPVKLVWFGQMMNRGALIGAMPILAYMANRGHEFTLRIIDEGAGIPLGMSDKAFPIDYIPWTLETINANLLDCDVAVLPPYPGPWGSMKSDNKLAQAWWCGLPTVSGHVPEELDAVLGDVQERARQGHANRKKAEKRFDIAQSVAEWRRLLEGLR